MRKARRATWSLYIPKRGFSSARRTGAMRTRCTPQVRTAREPPDTEHPLRRVPWRTQRIRFRYIYKRGFSSARRREAMRTRCTPQVRTAREPPDTEHPLRRVPWNAAGQVPLHSKTRVLVRKAHRCDAYWMYVSACGTKRTRFRYIFTSPSCQVRSRRM